MPERFRCWLLRKTLNVTSTIDCSLKKGDEVVSDIVLFPDEDHNRGCQLGSFGGRREA